MKNIDIIKEIKEKIKNEENYLHPCNKERQEDMKKFGFISGCEFTSWMQQNGIMKSPTDVKRE